MYPNEIFARLYAEHQAAALQAATSNLVSPSDSSVSGSSSQISPSTPLNGSLANIFGKNVNRRSRGTLLSDDPTSFLDGMNTEMEAKAREFASAAALLVGGMPSPPGLLRPSSAALNGTLNDFSAASARPIAVRNKS